MSSQEVVPQIIGYVLGIIGRGQRVTSSPTTYREHDLNASILAVSYAGTDGGAAIGSRVAMASKVDFRGLAIAELVEEGYVNVGVFSGVAGLG